MIVTVDELGRVALPESASPGQIFDLKESGASGFLLTRVEASNGGVSLVRKDGYLVATTKHAISQAQTRRALDEFP